MPLLKYNIFRSVIQFLKILFGRKYDLVFYYPQHFNRENGMNPFFLDFIQTCNSHSLRYLLIEEPSIETNNPRNMNAFAFDIFFLKILVLRKLIPLKCCENFEFREQFIGKIINFLSFYSFKAPVYITISNSMGGMFRGVNKKARILDLQHGIINSKQPGYFCSTGATDLIRLNSKEVLVYGPFFENPFMSVDESYYRNKVHIIGTNTNLNKKKISKGTRILVSMQIIETESRTNNWFQEQVELLYNQFKDIEASNYDKDLIILIKHHPRSLQSYDTSKLVSFPFVKIFSEIDSLKDICLHVTFFSTTTFEFAAKGIPTLFLFSELIPEGKTVFHDEYEYPFKNPITIVGWLEKLKNSETENEIDRKIKNWYHKFYNSYDENLFLKLVKPETV